MLHPCNSAWSWQNRSPVSVASLLSSIPESESVGDPAATRTVYITVGLLVLLGVALAALAVWLWRRTRPEPQLLAPLEEMQTRRWRKQDPAGQRRALDASRPAGARPVRREAAEPAVDTDFGTTRPVVGFDDLVDDPPEAEAGADELDEPESVDSVDEQEGGGDDGVDESEEADGGEEGEDDDDSTAEQAMPEQDLLGPMPNG